MAASDPRDTVPFICNELLDKIGCKSLIRFLIVFLSVVGNKDVYGLGYCIDPVTLF